MNLAEFLCDNSLLISVVSIALVFLFPLLVPPLRHRLELLLDADGSSLFLVSIVLMSISMMLLSSRLRVFYRSFYKKDVCRYTCRRLEPLLAKIDSRPNNLDIQPEKLKGRYLLYFRNMTGKARLGRFEAGRPSSYMEGGLPFGKDGQLPIGSSNDSADPFGDASYLVYAIVVDHEYQDTGYYKWDSPGPKMTDSQPFLAAPGSHEYTLQVKVFDMETGRDLGGKSFEDGVHEDEIPRLIQQMNRWLSEIYEK